MSDDHPPLWVIPTLAIMNMKGGVGKTTYATALSEFAARNGLRVLLVDLDMQANSTAYFLEVDEVSIDGEAFVVPPVFADTKLLEELEAEERSSIADIFEGKECVPHPTNYRATEESPGLISVFAAHGQLLEAVNIRFSNVSGQIVTAAINVLNKYIQHPYTREDFDIVIIDTGPSRNPTFRAALRTATHVLTPFEPEPFPLQGINQMLSAIEAENDARFGLGPNLRLIGLSPNKYKKNLKMHQEVLSALVESVPHTLVPEECFIPHATPIMTRSAKGSNPETIFDMKSRTTGRKQMIQLAKYVFTAMANDWPDEANLHDALSRMDEWKEGTSE